MTFSSSSSASLKLERVRGPKYDERHFIIASQHMDRLEGVLVAIKNDPHGMKYFPFSAKNI